MPRDISEIKHCEFCKKEVFHLNHYCLKCQPVGYDKVVGALEEKVYKVSVLTKKLTEKNQELQTEREATQQALQTSQEWHERQKAEIIDQWKTKLQTFIQQRKTQLQQEIQLIKEVLHE